LQVKSFGFYALAKYERNDVINTAQLIFFRNIEIAFQLYQILASLFDLKDTPTDKAKEAFLIWNWLGK
jgi:hypothetical protein